jgi:hypothetical protein
MSNSLFAGRSLVIASMHGKERVIAPGLESSLGVDTLVSDRLNTDLLGTFSGEQPRTISPLDAAREQCPQCGSPGFEIRDINPGLPCDDCGTPTRSTLSRVHACWKCTYQEEKKFPLGKLTESPQFCDICNP